MSGNATVGYNIVFEKLVGEGSPRDAEVSNLVAYALYKGRKREIRKHYETARTDGGVTDYAKVDELMEQWVSSVVAAKSGEDSLVNFSEEGESIVARITANTLEIEAAKIQKSEQAKATKRVNVALDAFCETPWYKRIFVDGFYQAIISLIGLAIIGFVIAVLSFTAAKPFIADAVYGWAEKHKTTETTDVSQ